MQGGRDRRRDVGALARDAPRPAQRLVLGRGSRPAAGRSSTSAATASRSSAASSARRTGPSRSCAGPDTLVHPIEAEDNAIALIRFESGRDRPVRGVVDVPRRHGPARRGGRHRGDDLAEPLPAHRLRDVLVRRGRRLRGREGRDRRAAGSSRSATRSSELGYVDMFADMFDAIDEGRAADARRSTTATSSTR